MKIGTKSVLFGGHQFLLHPFFLFLAWWELFGFPWDLRLWFAFFLHDIGYWGKPNIDGPEGKNHPEFGAKIMTRLFGKSWGDLCLFHSRFYAKRYSHTVSNLCFADKYMYVFMPAWFAVFLYWCSGELKEYLVNPKEKEGHDRYRKMNLYDPSPFQWYNNMRNWLTIWVKQNMKEKSNG